MLYQLRIDSEIFSQYHMYQRTITLI